MRVSGGRSGGTEKLGVRDHTVRGFGMAGRRKRRRFASTNSEAYKRIAADYPGPGDFVEGADVGALWNSGLPDPDADGRIFHGYFRAKVLDFNSATGEYRLEYGDGSTDDSVPWQDVRAARDDDQMGEAEGSDAEEADGAARADGTAMDTDDDAEVGGWGDGKEDFSGEPQRSIKTHLSAFARSRKGQQRQSSGRCPVRPGHLRRTPPPSDFKPDQRQKRPCVLPLEEQKELERRRAKADAKVAAFAERLGKAHSTVVELQAVAATCGAEVAAAMKRLQEAQEQLQETHSQLSDALQIEARARLRPPRAPPSRAPQMMLGPQSALDLSVAGWSGSKRRQGALLPSRFRSGSNILAAAVHPCR